MQCSLVNQLRPGCQDGGVNPADMHLMTNPRPIINSLRSTNFSSHILMSMNYKCSQAVQVYFEKEVAVTYNFEELNAFYL